MSDDTKGREVSIAITLEGRGSFSGSGPDDLVFKALDLFKTQVASTPPVATQKATATATPPDGAKDKEVGQRPASLQPIGPFLKSKAPRNNAQAVAVAAVWQKESDGTTKFTIDTLETLYKRSGRKPAGNFARDVGTAAKEGWLEAGEKRGEYVLTSFGEDYVQGLPVEKGK